MHQGVEKISLQTEYMNMNKITGKVHYDHLICV